MNAFLGKMGGLQFGTEWQEKDQQHSIQWLLYYKVVIMSQHILSQILGVLAIVRNTPSEKKFTPEKMALSLEMWALNSLHTKLSYLVLVQLSPY